MPRNGSGVYTLPAGNPVVAFTTITTAWANPTMSDIGNELTNSLDRQGRGGMLAPFRIFDGTVSQPGLGFLNEVGLGLYREASGIAHLVNSGTVVMTLNPSRAIFPNMTEYHTENMYKTSGFKSWVLVNSAGILSFRPSTTVNGEVWNTALDVEANPDTGVWDFAITPKIAGVSIITSADLAIHTSGVGNAVHGLGTISTQNANSVVITGGTISSASINGASINSSPIGATTPAAGTFLNVNTTTGTISSNSKAYLTAFYDGISSPTTGTRPALYLNDGTTEAAFQVVGGLYFGTKTAHDVNILRGNSAVGMWNASGLNTAIGQTTPYAGTFTGAVASTFTTPYNADANSRSWRLANDFLAFGDFQIQQSTTQTGSVYTNRFAISAGGLVGIPTINASYNMNVVGTLNATGGLFVNGVAVSVGTGSNWTVSGADIYRPAGNVGIGVAPSAGNLLHLFKTSAGAVGPRIYLQNNGAAQGDAAEIAFDSSTSVRAKIKFEVEAAPFGGGISFWTGTSGGTERMRIDQAGNVGIGAAPTTQCHIFGNNPVLLVQQDGGQNGGATLRLTAAGGSGVSALEHVQGFIFGATNGGPTTYFGPDKVIANAKVAINNSTGLVGIPTINASYNLNVTGSINATGAIYVNGVAVSVGTGSNWTVSGADIWRPSGNVGIGALPTRKLDVAGTFGATGAAVFGSTVSGAFNGTVGATTPATGAFTTLTGAFNGTIGATTPAGATVTTLHATSTAIFDASASSSDFIGPIGASSPFTGRFTTLTTTGDTTLGDASTDTLNVGNGGIIKNPSGNTGFGIAPTERVHVAGAVLLAATPAPVMDSNTRIWALSAVGGQFDSYQHTFNVGAGPGRIVAALMHQSGATSFGSSAVPDAGVKVQVTGIVKATGAYLTGVSRVAPATPTTMAASTPSWDWSTTTLHQYIAPGSTIAGIANAAEGEMKRLWVNAAGALGSVPWGWATGSPVWGTTGTIVTVIKVSSIGYVGTTIPH